MRLLPCWLVSFDLQVSSLIGCNSSQGMVVPWRENIPFIIYWEKVLTLLQYINSLISFFFKLIPKFHSNLGIYKKPNNLKYFWILYLCCRNVSDNASAFLQDARYVTSLLGEDPGSRATMSRLQNLLDDNNASITFFLRKVQLKWS